MKKLLQTLLLFAITTSVFAQVPQKISYQSVIRNASNTLITNATVGIKVSLLQGGANGVSVYAETHTPTTNTNGLVSLAIGTGTVVEGVFANVDWSTGSYFVKTEIDPTGGTNYALIGTSELLSVPFALHAKTASNSGGGGMPSGTKAGEILYWNGTAWVTVAPGTRGQTLSLCDGNIPTWGPCPVSLPVVQTVSSSGLGTVMTVNANVVSDGGTNITYRGVLFGLNPNLTLSNPLVGNNGDNVSGNNIGTYTKSNEFWDGSNMSNIPTAGTVFYARAYAINSLGVAYGDEVSYTVPTHLNKGDFYQGGYVINLDKTLQHGLIVAPSDQSVSTAWNVGANTLTNATGTAIGTGESNTGYIMFNQGNSALAAKLCFDLELGGYNDWFLPSADEINLAKSFLEAPYTEAIVITLSCDEPISYWTSTEDDLNGSVTLSSVVDTNYWNNTYIHTYMFYTCSKDKLKRVRAMRKF